MDSDRQKSHLTLYVAGDLPNSRRARAHLEDWMSRMAIAATEVEVVDVLAHPGRAADDDVFITPALVFSAEGGRQVFVGDLSDDASLDRLRSTDPGSHDTV